MIKVNPQVQNQPFLRSIIPRWAIVYPPSGDWATPPPVLPIREWAYPASFVRGQVYPAMNIRHWVAFAAGPDQIHTGILL
jgi:hypothetical protein